MIRLDLEALSEDQLKEIIFQRCSAYGAVASVTIVKHDRSYNFALAAVEMPNDAESFAVLKDLGDSKVETMVVIRIEQEDKSAS